jgi:catechol 2,3-dioxygenase-like lactoylglutathione lyase family enzyme
MGIKVTHLDPYLSRFTADGFRLDPVRIGRETTPQTYVTAPEGFRIEIVEDSTLPRPMVNHHLHYWLADTAAVNHWYAEVVGLEPTLRGPYPSGGVPGNSLTFAPLGGQAAPGVPTRGRMMDSIGFEIVGLRAYCERLKARGVVFEKEYGMDAELGINAATITDPWGVTIRFTEGLSAVAGLATFEYVDRYVVPSGL